MSVYNHEPPIVESLPTQTHLRLLWQHEGDTQAFARCLAQQPAVRHAVIALRGDLGAGKTTLVRHLLTALGVTGRIKSPTYAVVEPHEAPQLLIWHFDFYRFNDPLEWEDAGFREIFASQGLKLVEWPDNAAGLLPVCDLVVSIEALDESKRQVTLHTETISGLQLMEGCCS